MRAGGKRFYFDVEANDRGTFIRLSEVSSTECKCSSYCGGTMCTADGPNSNESMLSRDVYSIRLTFLEEAACVNNAHRSVFQNVKLICSNACCSGEKFAVTSSVYRTH